MSCISRFVIFCLLGLLLSCSERNRQNPFDPGGNLESPLELSIAPQNTAVRLNWILLKEIDFIGFNLYRSEADSSGFSLINKNFFGFEY